MKNVIILSSVFSLLSSVYAEERTTTIPTSELIITGQDKHYLEWKEELKEVELSFPPIPLPTKPKSIEKEEEKIELIIQGHKEKFVIKEKPLQFLPSETLPWIKASIGNYNFFTSSILFAKEKRGKGGFLLIERERMGGFKYNGKNDFHSQNKDKVELSIGGKFNDARISLPFSFLNQEVFLPYEARDEKRKRLHLKVGYETPFYNNLKFSGFVEDEKKDSIESRGLGTRLSFDFAKKNRLNISAENKGGFEERNFLKCLFSFHPTKKQWKKKEVLIKGELGLSSFKNSSTIFQPEVLLELKSKLRKDIIANLSLESSCDFESFSSLYFKTPYATISTNLKPERVVKLSCGIDWKKQRFSLKNSLFILAKKDAIEWQKKTPGLYSPKNSGSLASLGISGNANYSIRDKIDIEFLISLIGLSRDINYTPGFQQEVILRYKKGPLFITPKLIFKGSQKTDSSNIPSFVILNIEGHRRISNEFEVFFNIENLLNNKYMEMEDYPAKRLFASCGLKIRL